MNLRSAIWDGFFYCPSRSWHEDDSVCSEEIVLHTKDEKKLVCLYLNSNAVEKQGAIFLLHGRQGNASKCVKYVKPLLKEGFDIFIVDWRGYGKSEGHANHKNVIEDSILAMHYFLSLKKVQRQKKIIMGLSLGGQVAIHLAKKFESFFDAMIVEGGITSFKKAVCDFYPGIIGTFFSYFISLPYAAEEDIKHIKHLPKLFIHNKHDQIVAYQCSEILFKNARQPKFKLSIDGGHLHGLKKENQFVYIEAIRKVLSYSNQELVQTKAVAL